MINGKIDRKIGEMEIITFGTTRDDDSLSYPINGLISGLSTGHIAIRMTFTDQYLFNKYIKNNSKIPHNVTIDPQTNNEIYEVYISFWPQSTGKPWSKYSKLETHKFDCEQSANYSSMDYNPRFTNYLKPLVKIVAPNIAVGKDFMYSSVTLPPSIIVHLSRLKSSLHTSSFSTEQQNEILSTAELFAVRYRTWRVELINRQNAEFDSSLDQKIIAQFARSEKIALAKVKISERLLKNQMFPDENLDQKQFIKKLEPFITFGNPEKDVVQLPLVHAYISDSSMQEKTPVIGLDLEPMLEFIQNIADNPEEHPYNLFDNNCAQVVLDILLKGCNKDLIECAKNALTFPWYVRWFGITTTPTMLLKLASDFKIELDKINQAASEISLYQPKYTQTADIFGAELLSTHKYRGQLEKVVKPMHFYNQNDDDSDELPTSKVEIAAKIIEKVSCLRY